MLSQDQAFALAESSLERRGLRSPQHMERLRRVAQAASKDDAPRAIEREAQRILDLDSFDAIIGF